MTRIRRDRSNAWSYMGAVVLVADDDVDIVRFVELNLRLEGFEVVVANDGQDALDKARHVRPALIVLDTMMPRLDGYEVCSRLRDEQPDRQIPVIMLTAKSLDADKAMAFTAGADDWVTKPFDPADLVSRVKDRLRA
jgi:DNA-binding response OmpR family regulator